MLDAVEHRGEHFTIVRRGKAIAELEPVRAGRGRDLKALLSRYGADPDWGRDLHSVRELLRVEDRS